MVGYVKNKKEPTNLGKINNFLIMLLFPCLFLLLWEYAAKAGWIRATILPPPTKLWETFCSLLDSGKLQTGLLISMGRVVAGFLIGAAAGIVFGFLMGLFAGFNRALSLFVSVLKPIPTIALIPIFIIVFGIGEKTNIGVIVVGSFWPVLLNTISGVQSVDEKLLELAYVYRLKNTRIVFRIIVPSAMTQVLTGLRLGVGTAWMSVVAAEMIGASQGIGYMIMFARELAQPANMYVEVLIIGLIGLLLDRVLLSIQNRVNKKSRGIAA